MMENKKRDANLSLQELLGKSVMNRQHELLGYVLDVEIGPDSGRIHFLELCLDSSEPKKSVHIPWSQVSVGSRKEALVAPFSLRFLHSIAKPCRPAN